MAKYYCLDCYGNRANVEADNHDEAMRQLCPGKKFKEVFSLPEATVVIQGQRVTKFFLLLPEEVKERVYLVSNSFAELTLVVDKMDSEGDAGRQEAYNKMLKQMSDISDLSISELQGQNGSDEIYFNTSDGCVYTEDTGEVFFNIVTAPAEASVVLVSASRENVDPSITFFTTIEEARAQMWAEMAKVKECTIEDLPRRLDKNEGEALYEDSGELVGDEGTMAWEIYRL